MKKFLVVTVLLLILGASLFVVVRYWSFVFAKQVNGVIVDVKRVGATTAILNGDGLSNKRSNNKDIFSFAVGIQDKTGDIHTASSEDRQWAIAKVGQCAQAKFYPYPPWELGKAGTYFNARLLHLRECSEGLDYLKKMGKIPSEQEEGL